MRGTRTALIFLECLYAVLGGFLACSSDVAGMFPPRVRVLGTRRLPEDGLGSFAAAAILLICSIIMGLGPYLEVFAAGERKIVVYHSREYMLVI